MTNPFAKQAAALAAALTLLSGGSAYADTAAVATVMATATVSTPSIINSPAGIVFAANSRETNLQKTPTSIIVSGIESASKRRAQR